MRRVIPVIAGAVALAVVVALLVAGLAGGSDKRVTAYFPEAIALYKGTSVRMLGVPIGTVTLVQPVGTEVKVEMTYDPKYKVPADAVAALVPPSIVSDRYVQLAPAYTGGPTMADGAVIPENRTEVPVELDQIFSSLNDLNVALGPNGANKHGALSRLIQVGAANMNGNGQAMNDALSGVSRMIETLANHRNDLFGTVANLQQFTTMLANDDAGVRNLNDMLAQVSVQLNGERGELGDALRNLSIALTQVAAFVHDNKNALTGDIKGLTSVTSGIVKEKQALSELLDLAPLGLQNLALAYDPATHTLRTRSSQGETSSSPSDPSGPLCQLLSSLKQPCPSRSSGGPASPGAPSANSSLLNLLSGGGQ